MSILFLVLSPVERTLLNTWYSYDTWVLGVNGMGLSAVAYLVSVMIQTAKRIAFVTYVHTAVRIPAQTSAQQLTGVIYVPYLRNPYVRVLLNMHTAAQRSVFWNSTAVFDSCLSG